MCRGRRNGRGAWRRRPALLPGNADDRRSVRCRRIVATDRLRTKRPAPDPSVKGETGTIWSYPKGIYPDVGISFGYGWRHLDQVGPPHNPSGFGNLEIGGQWQFFKNEPHEAVAMFALSGEIGGTGAGRVGADGFTTLTPAFRFGKRLGDLPGVDEPAAPGGRDWDDRRYSIPLRRSTSTTIFDPDTGDATRARYRTPLECGPVRARHRSTKHPLPDQQYPGYGLCQPWDEPLARPPLVEFRLSPSRSTTGSE